MKDRQHHLLRRVLKPLPVSGQTVIVIADARRQNFRFKLEMHTCGSCKRAEYAWTCDE